MAIIKRETDYALRALAKLARDDECLPVSALAEQEDIPEVFLRKIMQELKAAGIVESRQGPFGGYLLNSPAEELSVLDVLEAVQGPLVMNECFAEPEICSRVEFCPLRKRLVELQVELDAKLAEITVGGIARELPREEGAPR